MSVAGFGVAGFGIVACSTPNAATSDTQPTADDGTNAVTDAKHSDTTANSDGSANANDTASSAADAAPKPVCKAEVVGKHGVGKPCTKAEDCHGQLAVTCNDDLGEGAPKMCVQYCFGFPGECDGAVCMTRGKKPAICVPAACAAEYTVLVPSGATCTDDCTEPATKLGVGKPCTTHGECANQIAKTCPYVFKASNQKWCSMLCSEDEDCGEGAVCYRRKTIEHGVEFTIGSCARAACCEKP